MYTKEEKNKLFQAWEKSDKNMKSFCISHAIPRTTFYGWLKKHQKECASVPSGFTHIPSNVITTAKKQVTKKVRIDFPNGVCMHIPADTSTSWIITLIQAYHEPTK